MEYSQFKQLLELKGIREKETVSQLNDFISKFPYCQTSRLLYAKALHDQNNIHYEQHLKLAAAYAPNREVLRDLIEMKTEEVEFNFPLSKKEEPVHGLISHGKEDAIPVTGKTEVKFDEWYSEDEISGRAFEEQKEKEKPVDAHALIKQRLSEILGSTPSAPAPKRTEAHHEGQKEWESSEKIPEDKVQKQLIVPAEINVIPIASVKPDPEETVYPEEILAEKKLEEELIHPTPEKSEEEKVIIAQAGKARDVLDRMELEHAMEESILDSLEKLPILKASHPPPPKENGPSATTRTPFVSGSVKGPDVSKDVDVSAPRSFTDWLRSINPGSSAGFEEVKAPNSNADFSLHAFAADEDEDQENLLSDDELIEKFLLEDPKIEPSKAEFYSPVAQAKKSVMYHDDVVSETLAQIYLRQGNTQKARWCYEKLILLHPEKSAFFAALLKEIPMGSDEGNKR